MTYTNTAKTTPFACFAITMLLFLGASSLPAFAQTTHTVTMVDGAETGQCEPDCFVPGILSIDAGDTVTFVNSKPHPTIIAGGSPYFGPDGTFHSGPIGAGQSFQFTFNDNGIYPYFDMISPWMQGTIQVGSQHTNTPPVPDAGNGQRVDEGVIVVLSGTATDADGDQIRYTWRQVSGTTVMLGGADYPGGITNSQHTHFVAPDVEDAENLRFQLTARDIYGFGTDTVDVTVDPVTEFTNRPPVADAGPDVSFEEGTIVTLDGSGSYDPDGDAITYQWTQTQGENMIPVEDDPNFDSSAENPQFAAPQVNSDIYIELKLVVTDIHGARSFDDRVRVTITDIPALPQNQAPVARNDMESHLGFDPVQIDVLFNDYDPDGDDISIESVDTTADTLGTVTINEDRLGLFFDPQDGVSGETGFSYTITDGDKTDTADVLVNVIDASGSDENALLYIPNPDTDTTSVDANMGLAVAQSGANILASTRGDAGDYVYMFDENGRLISEIQNPSGTNNEFGYSLASSDAKIYVGAPKHDTASGQNSAGAVYVYDTDGTYQAMLAPDSLDSWYLFGDAISAFSDKIAVGVPGYDVTVQSDSDARDGIKTPGQLTEHHNRPVHSIVYNPLDETRSHGTAVPSFDVHDDGSIRVFDSKTEYGRFAFDSSGNDLLLLVDEKSDTSYLFDMRNQELRSTTYGSAGAVYVYDAQSDTLEYVVENPSPASNDSFGDSVATVNGNLIVGMPGYDVMFDEFNGNFGVGAVYYLGTDGSQIRFIPNPALDNPQADCYLEACPAAADDFGESVAATASHILAGAPDDGAGAIWVIDPQTGDDLHYIPNPDTVSGENMGLALAATDDKILAGERQNNLVRIFDAASGTLVTTIQYTVDDIDFGASVSAFGDDSLLVGSPSDDVGGFNEGSVSVYSASPAAQNSPPVALPDTGSANDDAQITIDVLSNDYDPDGDDISIDTLNTAGTAGTAQKEGDSVTFAANLNFEGDTEFSYRITDGTDFAVATVTITVDDTLPPAITLLGDNPQEIDAGSGYFELGATTDDGSPVSINADDFQDVPGSYAIYYDSADPNGNDAATITRTVNVVDNTSPIIAVPADQTFEATDVLTPLDSSDYGTATATDNVDLPEDITITSDAPESFPLGDTIIEWTATDTAGNPASAEQTVTVQDTTVPSITAPDNYTAEATAPYTVLTPDDYGTATASDIFGPVTITSDAPESFPLGNTVITYTATDANGLQSNAVQTITLEDTTPPIITLTGSNEQLIWPDTGYEELGATTDDGSTVRIDASELQDTVGAYSVYYDSTDEAGNPATQVARTVYVGDRSVYYWVCGMLGLSCDGGAENSPPDSLLIAVFEHIGYW